eukprot:XP_028356904.1 uncharacterized protein LOC114487979 isoform X1 [Physeter catodon]
MENPGKEIIRQASLKKQSQDAASDEGIDTTTEVQKSWSDKFSRRRSEFFVRMGTVTADQRPTLKDDLLAKAKSVTVEESGDYRVKLRGPEGEIPVNMWDLSKYPFWPYDHYQTLRKEWLRLKAKLGQPAPEDVFMLPHPGVDYLYNTCPYVMQTGTSALTSMSAHCILADGSRLPADVDKSMKIPAFTEANYTVTCGWFSDGNITTKETTCC